MDPQNTTMPGPQLRYWSSLAGLQELHATNAQVKVQVYIRSC